MATFVSLGSHCQAAYQIRRATKASGAQFFDWLVTPHGPLISLLKNRFQGFLASENVRVRGKLGRHYDVADASFGVRLLHDFPVAESVQSRLRRVQRKYRTLADRFVALSGSELIFIRHVDPINCRANKARELRAALTEYFGQNVLLVVASEQPPPEPWDIAGITFFKLTQPEPYIWSGLDNAWDALFDVARKSISSTNGS